MDRLLQLLGEVDREQGARLIHGHLLDLGPVQGRLARVLIGVCNWSVSAILASDWSVTVITFSDWSVTVITISDWSVTVITFSDWSVTVIAVYDWSFTVLTVSDRLTSSL